MDVGVSFYSSYEAFRLEELVLNQAFSNRRFDFNDDTEALGLMAYYQTMRRKL